VSYVKEARADPYSNPYSKNPKFLLEIFLKNVQSMPQEYRSFGANTRIGGMPLAKTSIPNAARSHDTIPALLARNVADRGAGIAMREKEFGVWQRWRWWELARDVRKIALGLLKLGVQPGDHIAIVGRNRPLHYAAILAAQSVRAIPAPLYQDAGVEEMAYVLDHCGARCVFCGDQEQVDKIIEAQQAHGVSHIEHVIYTDPRGMRGYDHGNLTALSKMLSEGDDLEAAFGAALDACLAEISADDVCVILYTSGTTGRPKGVVLSHQNIVAASKASCEFDQLKATDEVLAYLPMAWVGDFIFSVGQANWSGFCVNCPESADTMMTDLKEVGPSYFFAPPRVFEALLTQVIIRMEDAGAAKRWMFEKAMAHARKHGPAILDNREVGFLSRLQYRLWDILIYGPLKNALGLTRVRIGYTAGEAIGPEIFDFYRSLGINLKQLYGQTEASVFITQQPDGEVRADTVGVPSPGVEVKIANNGEVFYRSPGSFRAYYKNDESTKKTKDADGWVATGDAGFFEPSTGHLRIIDRAKDVGKLTSGGMFAPKFVENKLKFFPEILEAVVFGADRETCAAFINIDFTAVGNWAERNNISYASYQELAGHPLVLDTIQRHVESVNESVANDEMLFGCQIARFIVLHKELDADDGEVTRTRKVRRTVIEKKYQDLITALYDGSKQISTETEVTYEDGRKGKVKATLQIRGAKIFGDIRRAAA
jgi:long-chain acyl-CoA synthetase